MITIFLLFLLFILGIVIYIIYTLNSVLNWVAREVFIEEAYYSYDGIKEIDSYYCGYIDKTTVPVLLKNKIEK